MHQYRIHYPFETVAATIYDHMDTSDVTPDKLYGVPVVDFAFR